MMPTLMDGDYVVVSKSLYGSRLPRSLYEVPWLRYLTYMYPISLLEYDSKKEYKRLYSINQVQLGDVIVFNNPVYQNFLGVKRCSLIPGDTIIINNIINIIPSIRQQVFLNEDSLSIVKRRILQNYYLLPLDSNTPFVFTHSYYYVLGDNQDHSTDSRVWGALQDDHIIGKVCIILFSKSRERKIRWERFLKRVS